MAKRPHRFLTVVLAALIGLAAEAIAGPQAPDPEVFAARRQLLCKRLGKDPVLIFGASNPTEYRPFRQNNRFYYLTGVTEPGAALLLIPREKREILFLDPGDPKMLKWDGPRMKPGEASQRQTGIKETALISELPDVLDKTLLSSGTPIVNLPLWPEEIGTRIFDVAFPALEARRNDPLDGGEWRECRIRLKLMERYEGLEVRDASPVIRGMRGVKGPAEIAALREAGRISVAGMEAAIRGTRPGMYEYETEALMSGTCRRRGGQDWAYSPIVGSGPNALIMHYNKNDRLMNDGEVVLMDAAFSYKYYAMDITRTFPVGEKFTPEQRKAYLDLLEVQEGAIKRVKPGTSLMELHLWTNQQLRARGYGDALVHFLGHGLGLAVHDPLEPGQILRPGNVLTIEPGIYFYDKGFGMRIEDTVLVTADGCENLSAGIPKDIETIEAMKKP